MTWGPPHREPRESPTGNKPRSRNKAYLIWIICIVSQWVFFQRQIVIPAVLTFLVPPVQDPPCEDSRQTVSNSNKQVSCGNSSVLCFLIDINEFITKPFLIVFVSQLHIKLPNKLHTQTAMLTAEGKCIDTVKLLWSIVIRNDLTCYMFLSTILQGHACSMNRKKNTEL